MSISKVMDSYLDDLFPLLRQRRLHLDLQNGNLAMHLSRKQFNIMACLLWIFSEAEEVLSSVSSEGILYGL